MPEVIRLSTVASTMDVLHDLAADGAEAGTLVVAAEQTGGRGSRGRAWLSGHGGLWLSVLYRPEIAAGIELCGLRIGLAVAEAVEALHPGAAVQIKWPNDLMIGDRKLGVILCEARWQGDALAWVVAGLGLNVANPLPGDLAEAAIALAERWPEATPGAVEHQVSARLRALDLGRDRLRPGELSGLWRRDWLQGRGLMAPVAGTAAGIADDGALMVKVAGGATVAVRTGTVRLADPSLTP
jgi:BirA family biotin operon repressor/biotin-[acetyl-CoA-carboxylase] ligase